MTRNYDKLCELLDTQIKELKRAVEDLDRKNLRWHSYKIEGMLDAAGSILNTGENLEIRNKYYNYPDVVGINEEFHKKMTNLYGENWQ